MADERGGAILISKAIMGSGLARQSHGVAPITPDVVSSQRRIADAFFDFKLIPTRLSIADMIWRPSL